MNAFSHYPHKKPNRLLLLGFVAIIHLTGCKHLQLSPHPVPVYFDKQEAVFDDTVPPPELNNSNSPENDYLLENWF